MEESVSVLQQIRERFSCDDVDVRTYSPLTLAFIGDCVFDLIIRTAIVSRGNRAPEGLHKKKSRIVKAQTQALMVESLMDELSDDEKGFYRRGRNAKSYTTAKNASVAEYRKATGFEALIGYLYLTDRMDRILDLTVEGLVRLDIEI